MRLSYSGEDAKVKGTRKVGGAGKRKKEGKEFSPVLFSCSIQRTRPCRNLEQANELINTT